MTSECWSVLAAETLAAQIVNQGKITGFSAGLAMKWLLTQAPREATFASEFVLSLHTRQMALGTVLTRLLGHPTW